MIGNDSITGKHVIAPQALLALLAQSGQETISNEKLARRMDFQRAQSNHVRAVARLQDKLENSLHKNTCENKNKKTNKNTYPRVHKHCLRFEPHIGFESLATCTALLTDLATMANVELDDDILRKIEGIIALSLNLQTCTTAQQFFSAVFLYVRDFYDSSITKQVMDYVKTVIDELPYTSQGSDLFDPSWLELLRSIQTNWAMVKGNRAFKQFSRLLGVLVTLGLCDASNLKFEISGFKMFDDDILKKHMSAFDLLDAVFGTVTYFAEGFYLCFKTGSIQPLLVNDFAILELDNEYVTILAWWDLVKNGNLERFTGISESEFSYRLKHLIAKLTNVLPTLTGIDKKIVADKLLKIRIINNDYIASKMAAGIRKSPFAIELFGESNQGKTTFGDQLLDALLTSAGLPTDREYRASINTSDKFVSNWTSDKLVAIFDDLGNTKSNFVETAPSNYIIDFCNNQMSYANKADLDGKGKCFIEPELVLVTTNVKHLNAKIYSNCPYSIQRRMDLVMTIKCKPQFQRIGESESGEPIACGVDSAKIREYYTVDGVYTPPLIDDIWEITVERAIQPRGITDTAEYAPITWRGQVMYGVSATEAIQCAIEHYQLHRQNQIAIVDGVKSRSNVMTRCFHKGCPHLQGYCPDHSDIFENQLGFETASALFSVTSRVKSMTISAFERSTTKIERVASEVLYKKATNFLDKWDWICLLPEDVVDSPKFLDFMMWYNADFIKRRVMFGVLSVACLSLIGVGCGVSPVLVIYCATILISLIMNKSYQKHIYLEELKKRNDVLPTVLKGTRDKYAKQLCQVAAGVATLYFMAKVYKHYVRMQAEQSSLEPDDETEIEARDAQPNIWSSICKRPLPTSDYSKRVSVEQLQRMIENNLVYASLNDGKNPAMMANLLFIKSNLLLIPNHYFKDADTLEAVCYKADAANVGGNFTTRLCKAASFRIPETDLRLCYTSTGGSRKDITKYLPLSNKLSQCPARMAFRKKTGELLRMEATIIPCETNNGTGLFMGGEYRNLTGNTFNGMCGATWVSDTKDPCVLGIHLGGKADTPFGCFGTLTQDQVKDAETKVKGVPGVLVTGEGGHFEPHMFGEDITLDTPLHEKSPLRYLPSGSQFEYYGSCKGQSSSRSDVRRTPISKYVTEICGIENIWGAPKMQPEWFGWQKALENASIPAKPFPHELLAVSVNDYKSGLLPLIKKSMWKNTRPLETHENVNGVPGKKFLDAINMATSIGYPLTGPKKKHIIEGEPNPDGTLNREFTPFIMNEIYKCERLYMEGKRAYTVAKACKKDEVLPTSKEKCRIFYGNPITLTFLVRKYYLPVLRFLQMNPLKSECAVGINSHGPEWDEFYKHVMHFGEERLFGGDYGKYDQKLPSQLLLASLRILIDLARECDYSATDLRVMEAMAGDIVYSLVAVNGDLIGLQSGTHISGNSLTVILNGICGSLNLRNYFYSIYPISVPFREAAHMMTYGDDNIGTVSPKYPKFNIAGCSAFLKEYGQEYTMPDKESELLPYLSPIDFEFLKRFNVYHDAFNCNVGALLEKSIFKSLHCYMRPKKCELTPAEACALNIDGALREWFNHGESVYELRREQMSRVAEAAGIKHMCMGLSLSYKDRCLEWKRRYIEKVELSPEIMLFEPHAGQETRDLYLKAFADINMHVVCVDTPIVHQNFGEIDILFVKFAGKVSHYLVVEIKDSHCVHMRRRGRKQLRRVVGALHLLQPRSPIIGVLLTPYGYEMVEEAGGVGNWHTIGLPMFEMRTQLSLETDSQLSF